jgi:hypothetical protein
MSCVSGSGAYLRQQVIDKCTNWTGTFRGDVTIARGFGITTNTGVTFNVTQDSADVKTGQWLVNITNLEGGTWNGRATAYTFCDGTFVLSGLVRIGEEGFNYADFQLVAICQCCNRVANANVNFDYIGTPVVAFGHLNLLTLQ